MQQQYTLSTNLKFLWKHHDFTIESKIALPQDCDLDRSVVKILDRGYNSMGIPIFMIEITYPKYGSFLGWVPEYVAPVAFTGFQVETARPH